jgi:hypothetical protein
MLLFYSVFQIVGAPAHASLSDIYIFSQKWPDYGYDLSKPCAVAVDYFGNIFVADRGYHTISKFTSDGKFVCKWGSEGEGNGLFTELTGIAVDRSGNVYVAAGYCIQKFNSTGGFLTKWGEPGSKDGEFLDTSGLTVDSSGNVYAIDSFNNRIQKFSNDGKFICKWGSSGSENGQFSTPSDVAVDSSGNVYIVDKFNNRVQKFTSDGTFICKWGSEGLGDGMFDAPEGLALDDSGNIYVADQSNNRVQKFTSDGKFISKWGSNGSNDGQFRWAIDIAVDRYGKIYVVDYFNYRIQMFTSDGKFLSKIGSHGSGEGQFSHPMGIAIDNLGNVYVADSYNYRMQKFSNDGKLICTWGSYGSSEGQFKNPRGVAVDGLGYVYVADEYNRIQKFTSDGKFVLKWDYKDSRWAQFFDPWGVTADSFGNVYVVDEYDWTVRKFTSSGNYIYSLTGSPNRFRSPLNVAVDAFGNVYIADRMNNCIQKFTSDGKFILKWGSGGSDDGQFNLPAGIAVDSIGNVFVTEEHGCRVQKFSSSGKFICKWGSSGSDSGQFNSPLGIAVDSSGNIFVADTNNERIQKFTGPAILKNDVKILSVPYYYQNNPKWCALYSLSMILRYYGYPSSPWDIATDTQLPPAEAFKYETMMNYLHTFQYKDSIVVEDITPPDPGQLQYDQVVSWIKKGTPLFLGVTKGFFSHAVVVTGYNETSQSLYVNDPSGALFTELLKGKYVYSEPYISKAVKWSDLDGLLFTEISAIAIYPKNGVIPTQSTGTLNVGDARVIVTHGSSSEMMMPIIMDRGWRWEDKISHGQLLDFLDKLLITDSTALYNYGNITKDFSIKISIKSKDSEVFTKVIEFKGVKPFSAINYPFIQIPLSDAEKFNSDGNPYVITFELKDVTTYQLVEDAQIPFNMQAVKKVAITQNDKSGDIIVYSNSTVGAINKTSDPITVEMMVSGETGTIGRSAFYISNNLLQMSGLKIGDSAVTIDGVKATPLITNEVDGYQIAVTYRHSTHMLVLKFNKQQTSPDFTLYYIGGVLVAGIAIVLLRLRKRS